MKAESNATWEERHDEALFRGIVALLLSSRPVLYSLEGLSDVNGHGGERINKKVKQALKRLGKVMDLGDEKGSSILNEEMGKMGRGKRKVGDERLGQKRSKGDDSPSGKKTSKRQKGVCKKQGEVTVKSEWDMED